MRDCAVANIKNSSLMGSEELKSFFGAVHRVLRVFVLPCYSLDGQANTSKSKMKANNDTRLAYGSTMLLLSSIELRGVL